MNEALCLAVYGIVVAVTGPTVIRYVTRGGTAAPRWAVALWLSAVAGTAGAWVAAIVLFGRAVVGSEKVRHVLARCVEAVCAAALGAHGTPARWGVLVAAALLAVGVVTAGVRGGRALCRGRRRTLEHAYAARLIGRPDARLGIVVVDSPDRLVYAVAGRPAAIVVSEAALAALTEGQLHAVIAHERAHLAGRHHLILGCARAVATAMPRLPLFTACVVEIGRLVEMCADDTAARQHDGRALVTALLALAGPPPAPRHALAAAASGVTERAGRLLGETSPRRAIAERTGSAFLSGGLLAGPILAVTSAAAGFEWCRDLLLAL